MKNLILISCMLSLFLAGPAASAKKTKEPPFHEAKSWSTYKIKTPRDTWFIGIKDRATHRWACNPYERKRDAGKVLIISEDLFANSAYAGYIWVYGRLYYGKNKDEYVTGRGWYKLEDGEMKAVAPIGDFDVASYYSDPVPEVPLFECQKNVDGETRYYLIDGQGDIVAGPATFIESRLYPDGHTWYFAWDKSMDVRAINEKGQRVFAQYRSVVYFLDTEHLKVCTPAGQWGIMKRDGTVMVPCVNEESGLEEAWTQYKSAHNLL